MRNTGLKILRGVLIFDMAYLSPFLFNQSIFSTIISDIC